VRFDLDRAGVEISGIAYGEGVETPVVIHEVDPPGHTFRFRCPECDRPSAKFRPLEVEALDHLVNAEQFPAAFDVVFADRVSSATVELFRRTMGGLQMLEPSSKGAVGPALESAELVDVLKWSHEVRDSLHPGMLDARAGQLQIETLGSEGLRFRLGGEPWSHLDAPYVEAIDSAGAGDWLTAAFLSSLPATSLETLSRANISDALEEGQAVAALSCLYVGARALSGLTPSEMRGAAAEVTAGNLNATPTVRGGRRAEPINACPLCLRPALE
jgi:fructokinase